MFSTIDDLNNVFCHYDDGTIASVIECNRILLSQLVLAAVSANYWLSRHAMNIIHLGVDTIQTDKDTHDIPYLELITMNDWARLLDGPYSKQFPRTHIQYVIGWPLELLCVNQDDLGQILSYLNEYVSNREAILAAARMYLAQIGELVPSFDISIWQYLVQLSTGRRLAIDSWSKYSINEQKKIQSYLYRYGSTTLRVVELALG